MARQRTSSVSPRRYALAFRDRSKRSRNGGAQTRESKERRSGADRRKGRDRRVAAVARDRSARDLYRSDLDRHLWSWPKAKTSKKKKAKKTPSRRRSLVRIIASGAGMVGAAGISYLLYRKFRKKESDFKDDPLAVQGEVEPDDDSEDE